MYKDFRYFALVFAVGIWLWGGMLAVMQYISTPEHPHVIMFFLMIVANVLLTETFVEILYKEQKRKY